MDSGEHEAGMIERLIRRLGTAQVFLASVFLVIMMLHVGGDIFMRLVFNAPIIGTLETVSYYYMVSVVFLPLAFVELRNQHVFVDLIFRNFPNKLQIIIYVLGCTLAIAYYGLFCYQTALDAVKATREQETVMANILFYVWPSRWALPIGSGALILAIALNAARAVLTGVVDEEPTEIEAIS